MVRDLSEQWSREYQALVNRNIGLINSQQQAVLKNARICVCGLGGIGGPAFEILVRCGIEKFSVVDQDVFEPTNLNRQIFAFGYTMGMLKIDAAELFAKNINPAVQVEKHDHVDEENIAEILNQSAVILLAIDQIKPCIVISREARRVNIPLVEGWALPYANVRTIRSDTPTLEEVYGLPTQGRSPSAISDDEYRKLGIQVLRGLGAVEGVADHYDEAVISRIAQGLIPSFAPLVWLTSALMALEAIKVILHWGRIATSPEFAFYDPFEHRIPR